MRDAGRSSAERVALAREGGSAARRFTVAEANRAVVLVRRIVGDITPRYQELLALRDEHAELATRAESAARVAELGGHLKRLADELTELSAELREIGCVLKDYGRGMVDFPAEHDGRAICLCWQLGEPAIGWWHEWDAGFRGRRPVDELLEPPAD